LKQKVLQTDLLLTHTFRFQDAKSAYQLILDRSETFAGIVLAYDTGKKLQETVILKNNISPAEKVIAGMIGAGSFGQNFLLPAIQGNVYLKGIATARPNNARNVANKFGFEYCTGNAEEIINDAPINTIFIATRHDTHAEFVLKGLSRGKNIFVEKPLCLHESELDEIISRFNSGKSRLMCGFNRRFAPLVTRLKSAINTAVPVAINYRINAGLIPSGHWIHDRTTGGGRIIGEVCHFIDLCAFISNSPISGVAAFAMKDANGNHDTVVISLSMQNGSVASISYFSNGNKSEEKEFIEVYNGGVIARIHDFTELHLLSPKHQIIKSTQDKGHKQGLAAFTKAIATGGSTPIPESELFNSMRATFGVLDSIAAGGASLSIKS
jgi:polar amino acid transport system substrate-binding protein